jgi:predicted glycosyltransferase
VKRLLMYSQDGMGLGHLRRSTNIAEEVLARDEECDVLILADSPALSLISPQDRLDVLKLPTVIKTGSASWKSTAWRNGSLRLDIERVMKLRARLILQTLQEYKPDTILVDHMPVGALGELKPALDHAYRQPDPPRLVLGLRDILDTPTVIRRVWEQLDAYRYLRRYDAVLVYGDQRLHDSTLAYRLYPEARRIVYCNYVSSRTLPGSVESIPTEPFILLTGGGGSDAFPLADSFLEALPILNGDLRMDAVILTGPNMAPGDREALIDRAGPAARVEGATDNAEEWVQRAAAVITMGGYNSLCEVLKWHKKALVVPRPGPSTEQSTRTTLLAERGLVRSLEYSDLRPERLAVELLALLRDDGIPHVDAAPALDGASRAADVLLEGSVQGSGVAVKRAVEGLVKGGNGALVPVPDEAARPAASLSGKSRPVGLP